MLHWVPRGRWMQVACLMAVALLGLFVVASQSRGAVLALLLSVVAMPLWCRDRRSSVIAIAATLAAIVVFVSMQSLMLSRGASFRPQIFMAAMQMISERPWTGLGLGGDYFLQWEDHRFDHSHNLFTHVAIELGLPGLLLGETGWDGDGLAALQQLLCVYFSALDGRDCTDCCCPFVLLFGGRCGALDPRGGGERVVRWVWFGAARR